VRALVREHRVHSEQLVQPLFVAERSDEAGAIEAMPGIARLELDETVAAARRTLRARRQSVLLFGIPAAKDDRASSSYDRDGIIQRAIRSIKAAVAGDRRDGRPVLLRIYGARSLRHSERER